MDELQIFGVMLLAAVVPGFLLLRHLSKQADEKKMFFNPVSFGMGLIMLLMSAYVLAKPISALFSRQFDINAIFFGYFLFLLPASIGLFFIAQAYAGGSWIMVVRNLLTGMMILLLGLLSFFTGVAVWDPAEGGGPVYRDGNFIGWLCMTLALLGFGIYTVYCAWKNKDKMLTNNW